MKIPTRICAAMIVFGLLLMFAAAFAACSPAAKTKVSPASINMGSTSKRTTIKVGEPARPLVVTPPADPKPIVVHLVMPGGTHAPTPAAPAPAPEPALPAEPRPTPAKDPG